MRQAPEHLLKLIGPVVEGLGYECVGVEYHPHPKHGLLRVYIDSGRGILLDDCSRVSHQLSGMLDVEDPIPGNYHLEVSSPGEDRPLYTAGQFARFIGSTAQVQLFSPMEGRRKIRGVIEQVEGGQVTLNEQGQVFRLPLAAISKARLVPEHELTKQRGEKGAGNGK